MPVFVIPVKYEMTDEIEIEADSLEEAKERFHDLGIDEDYLSADAECVEGSMKIDEEKLAVCNPSEFVKVGDTVSVRTDHVNNDTEFVTYEALVVRTAPEEILVCDHNGIGHIVDRDHIAGIKNSCPVK